MNLGRIGAAVQALAINAVTIYGVFGLHWSVGTAIALYWSENVLRGMVILVLLAVWQLFFRQPDSGGIGTQRKFTIRTFLLFSGALTAAHAVFLAVILGFVIPRMSPAQRFEAGSFQSGLVIILILLVIELLVWLLGANRSSDERVQRSANAYVRRVVVLHLTIVLGMFGIVLFDRPTVLFASFAALKIVADLTLPIHRGPVPDQASAPTAS
jgi:phage-related holin